MKTLKNNKICIVVLFLECCVLLLMTMNCLRTRCDYSFTVDNLYTPSGLGEWISDENGTGYQVSSTEDLGDNILVNTDFFVLYPGSYSVKVVYDSQVSYLEGVDYTVGTGLLNLNSSHNEVYYYFDSMLLRDGLNSVEQTLQVTSPWKISDFQMTLTYSGQGSLTVYSIEITENVVYKYLCLLGISAFFIFLDTVCYLLFLERGYKHTKELGVLILIAAAACLPFLADWIIVGEDSFFWAARIRLLAEAFTGEGNAASLQSFLTDSSGYNASQMYGTLFLYLPAFLFYCGFSLTFVYNFHICFVTILTCLITYFCGLSVFKKSNPALLFSAIYTLNAPRLTCILSLASLGEMTAMAFFPLILAGICQIYSASDGKKIRLSSLVLIALGLGGILYSDRNLTAGDLTGSFTLSIVFSAAFGLILFLIYIFRKRWGSKSLAQSAACFVALLLCMAFIFQTGQIYSDQMRTASMERLSNNLYENLDNLGTTESYISYFRRTGQ